jgi:hypothetical protein
MFIEKYRCSVCEKEFIKSNDEGLKLTYPISMYAKMKDGTPVDFNPQIQVYFCQEHKWVGEEFLKEVNHEN